MEREPSPGGDLSARTGLARTPAERRSILVGSFWMVLISLALFWVPVVNGFIGGLVGGYKVRGVGRALFAAIVPVLVVSLGLWLLLAALDLPVVGFFAGAAIGLVVLFADVGLLLGAAVGGAFGKSRPITV